MHPPSRSILALLGAAAWCASAPLGAAAQTEGESLVGKDFAIDLVSGPVLGSGRIIGLSGAYTALATGIEGGAWNPAAYATRVPWDTSWFEWDLTFGLTPETIRNSDFDNNGKSGFTYGDFFFATVGVGLKFGPFGAGALFDVQTYDIGGGYDLALQGINIGAGYAFFDSQLVIGAAVRTAVLSVTQRGEAENLVEVLGVGGEIGAVLALTGQPFRLGLAARLPIESEEAEDLVAVGRMLPRRINLPWEIQTGVAYQLGARPLNPRWENPREVQRKLMREMRERRKAREQGQYEREQSDLRILLAQQRVMPAFGEQQAAASNPTPEGVPRDPEFWERERELRAQEKRELREELQRLQDAREASVRALSRRYLLISAEAIFVGPTEDGIGLESFLQQIEERSGEHVTVGLRLGIEGEPIADWLMMRAGAYLEPSRFAGVGYRAHATLGFDLRLFSWDLFELLDEFTLTGGAYADVAERYLNVGLSVGLWH